MVTQAHPVDGPSRTAGQQPIEDGEFMLIRGVPVFAEHETQAKDGRTLKFGRAELQAVAARNNERITLSGDYVPITIGHTPDPMSVMLGKASQPEVVGFAGPFTLGKIGPPGQERYSILADFRIFKEDWPKARKYPRRSPELWLEDSYDKMFLDPVCLLGAETPRLDMGVLYAASLQGRTVEKYTAVAPAAGNAFVPSEKYAADGSDGGSDGDDDSTDTKPAVAKPDASANDEGGMNEEKIVAMFLEAFRQSDMGQFLMQMMQKDAAPQPSVPQPDVPGSSPLGVDPSGAGAPPVPPAGAAPGAPPDAGGLPPAGGDLASAGGPPGMPPPPSGGLPPGIGGSAATGGQPPDVDKEKMGAGMMTYSRPAGDRLQDFERRLAHLEGENINERRVSQLFELVASGVPGIDDPRGLVASKLNYAKASDEQFAMIVEQYARQARMPLLGTFLPTPGADATATSGKSGPERYSKANADRAMQICEAMVREGKRPDYAAVLTQVANGSLT